MEDWFQASLLYQIPYSIYDIAVRPLHMLLARQTVLHRVLKGIHFLATASIFVLATFASTKAIALMVAASLLVLLVRLMTSPVVFRFTVVDLLVCLFFLTAVVSTFFSTFLASSIVGLAKFGVFFAGYLNFRFLVSDDQRFLQWLLALLVVLGVAESLVGLSQYFGRVQALATWQDPDTNAELILTRVFGTLKPYNPNLLAGFLIPAVAAGFGLSLRALTLRRWFLAILLGMMAMLILVCLVLTGSRGGYLAIIGMSATLFFFIGHLLWHEDRLKHRHKLKALWLITLLLGVGSVILAFFALPPLRHRFMSIFAMRENSSNSYRINVWLSTWEMIKHNWLVGIGPGNDTFKQVYGFYMVPGYNALSAYSIFLEIWVEQGIFGLLTFFVLIKLAGFRVLAATYSAMSLPKKVLMGTLLTGIVGSVIYGLFDTIWYRPAVNLLFWLFIAGVAVVSEDIFSERGEHHDTASA